MLVEEGEEKTFVFFYPEDFIEELTVPDLAIGWETQSFVAPPQIQEDLALLKQAQAARSDIEHFFIRVLDGDKSYRLPKIVEGDKTGYGSKISLDHESLADFRHRNPLRLVELDHMHSHVPIVRAADQNLANLPSAQDIDCAMFFGIRRSWVLGLDGKIAMCIANNFPPIVSNEVYGRTDQYCEDALEMIPKPNSYRFVLRRLTDCIQENAMSLLFLMT